MMLTFGGSGDFFKEACMLAWISRDSVFFRNSRNLKFPMKKYLNLIKLYQEKRKLWQKTWIFGLFLGGGMGIVRETGFEISVSPSS